MVEIIEWRNRELSEGDGRCVVRRILCVSACLTNSESERKLVTKVAFSKASF